MSSHTFLSLALLASTAFAAPSFVPQIVKKDGPGPCGPELDGQKYVSHISWYSDKDCLEILGDFCLYSQAADFPKGSYSCSASGTPAKTPYYARVEDSPYQDIQVVFTRDQSCPPNGPGAVFATLIDNKSCVEMNLGGETPGISVYPHGGSGIAKIAGVEKRDDSKCNGFSIESQEPSYSETVQISNIVDCTNSADAGCTIEVGSEHTESVSTSYSISAGGGIEGIFSVEATFGQEYTSSSTTSLQEGFSVPKGQKGYLAAYSAATLFKGKFTDCEGDEKEHEGQALVIKKEGFTYSVVNTGTK